MRIHFHEAKLNYFCTAKENSDFGGYLLLGSGNAVFVVKPPKLKASKVCRQHLKSLHFHRMLTYSSSLEVYPVECAFSTRGLPIGGHFLDVTLALYISL